MNTILFDYRKYTCEELSYLYEVFLAYFEHQKRFKIERLKSIIEMLIKTGSTRETSELLKVNYQTIRNALSDVIHCGLRNSKATPEVCILPIARHINKEEQDIYEANQQRQRLNDSNNKKRFMTAFGKLLKEMDFPPGKIENASNKIAIVALRLYKEEIL